MKVKFYEGDGRAYFSPTLEFEPVRGFRVIAQPYPDRDLYEVLFDGLDAMGIALESVEVENVKTGVQRKYHRVLGWTQ